MTPHNDTARRLIARLAPDAGGAAPIPVVNVVPRKSAYQLAVMVAADFLLVWILMLIFPTAAAAVGLDLAPSYLQTLALYVVTRALFTAASTRKLYFRDADR